MKQLLHRFFIGIVLALGLLGPATLAAAAPTYACTNVTLSSPIASGGGTLDCTKPGGVIFAYLRQIITFLSGAIGLVIVLMIVIGGVQYTTSIGDPGRVKEAKNRITNAITALILFLLMFAILNFLIPGGVIG